MSQVNRMEEMTAGILPLNEEAMERARLHLDQLTKPPGSLGKLEEIAVQLAGITGELAPELGAKTVVVMAGDHGVCEEGVSAFPSEVTCQMVMNFLNGGAAVNVLARHASANVVCVDMGIDGELEHPDLLQRKIRRGTRNMARGAAMTRDEAEAAVRAGYELALELAERGTGLFATGEMGIGNTTPSAALLAAFAGISPAAAAGRGTGISDQRLVRKIGVIEQALQINQPDPRDPLDVLAKVGGLEIAGLTGLILGAAASRRPIVIDGFISTAAALTAVRLAPAAKGYMIGSHLSGEQGHALLVKEAGISPMLGLDMRLGEGTGAVLAFHLVEAAVKIMAEMATFAQAGVSGGEEYS
ncbi:nicotinate-nucleotide--dimethylbenzimidazole phosphoribosyltransferase [Paenibacillus sp. YN15]|uniref:nicotinate-nucleotide--dimethylbenzimidazole phosphoribosyltransferase n=1 Tax=Paenibacillus sp. YN15 TaxID=1742774 RepID=UPI000DCC63A1|nr:nicotinate-nucleotide--dimethylbenzimidazole phosphoribosyltransferase [Paenibacillus sp. YN15]RAU97617.1 nicotinate-nucleotide--dimethylbenzimidazole phosphoribosyltransferase [Paenibacillus sp. YN15]